MNEKLDLDDWMGRWDVVIKVGGYAELAAYIQALEDDRDSWAEQASQRTQDAADLIAAAEIGRKKGEGK